MTSVIELAYFNSTASRAEMSARLAHQTFATDLRTHECKSTQGADYPAATYGFGGPGFETGFVP